MTFQKASERASKRMHILQPYTWMEVYYIWIWSCYHASNELLNHTNSSSLTDLLLRAPVMGREVEVMEEGWGRGLEDWITPFRAPTMPLMAPWAPCSAPIRPFTCCSGGLWATEVGVEREEVLLELLWPPIRRSCTEKKAKQKEKKKKKTERECGHEDLQSCRPFWSFSRQWDCYDLQDDFPPSSEPNESFVKNRFQDYNRPSCLVSPYFLDCKMKC